VRARRRTQKEVGLGNALPQEWKMKGGGKIQRFFKWSNSHWRIFSIFLTILYDFFNVT
jgi:hypothetical protein